MYQQQNHIKRSMKAKQFQKLAIEPEKQPKADSNFNSYNDTLEKEFWDDILKDPPLYGTDTSGTLFSADLYHWNLSKLTEQNILKYLAANIQGVTSTNLYFGMWRSMFAWHTEDMDLFSINYMHCGKPKYWYGIPERDRRAFEKLAAELFPRKFNSCRQFLRHKTTMIHPSILRKAGITVYSDIQREREFIITFPGAYHSGFNAGYNCAEAVNFALESWIPRGQMASVCYCKKDSIAINMDVFLYNYHLAKNSQQNITQNNESTNSSSSPEKQVHEKRKKLESTDPSDEPAAKKVCV